MNNIKILILAATLGVANQIVASNIFPTFETNSIAFSVPTNTPGCFSDPTNAVGTNYIYKLNGQIFSNPVDGHIRSVTEGFGAKTDESTPWKTLTELLAAYQEGSLESEIRPLYTDGSSGFMNKVYNNEQMKSRYQQIGLSIIGMQAIMGYDYSDGYLAQVRLDFKDGHHEISQFYFVLDGGKYKISSLHIKKPDPSLINIGLFLNKKSMPVPH